MRKQTRNQRFNAMESHYTLRQSYISVVIIEIAVLQSTMPGVHTMPCATSRKSIRYVERCPRNSLEWDVRADLLNCSSISQTCVSTDMFRYHCVLNADGTNLLELCAPYKYIYAQKCAEFDAEGTIIQENSNTCSNASVPCPKVYISTDAYKYQSCYDGVKFLANNGTTNETTNCKSENSFFIYRSITICVTIMLIVLAIGFIIAIYRKRKLSNIKYDQSGDVLIEYKEKDRIKGNDDSAVQPFINV